MENTIVRILASKITTSKWFGDFIKRTFDVVVSAIVLALLAPLFGLIAWAIKRESPGPAFFLGPRMGLGGMPFNIIKFRTMYERSESYQGPKVTAQDDPRVTPLGRWLRETKLNELPQFWNVLKGEMSLVGPRPEDPSIAKTWSKEVRKEVLSVRPGITSPASIQYRNEESLLSTVTVMQKYMQELAPDKMRLDQLYIRYRSLWLDIDILLWTALLLLPKLKSVALPEQLLFVGPVTRLFQRHMSWFTIDLLVTFTSIGFTGLVWRSFGPLHVGWIQAVGMAAGFALLFSLCAALLGVNRINWAEAADSDVYDLFPAWIFATLVAVFVNLFLNRFPGELILAASFLALLGFVVVRYHVRLLTGLFSRIDHYRSRVQSARERVLIIGSGPTAELANWLFTHPENANRFWVLGSIDDDPFKQGMRIHGVDVLGTCSEISNLLVKNDIGVVVIAGHQFIAGEMHSILDHCRSTKARWVLIPDIFALLNRFNKDTEFSWSPGNGQKEEIPSSACLHCLAKLSSIETGEHLESNFLVIQSNDPL